MKYNFFVNRNKQDSKDYSDTQKPDTYIDVVSIEKKAVPLSEHEGYKVHLSNGMTLIGVFSFYQSFLIKVLNEDDSFNELIFLTGRIYDTPDHPYFQLEALQTDNISMDQASSGLGCLMLRLLLTFIADYNCTTDHAITRIEGSIDPLDPDLVEELKSYYRRRSGTTDFFDRIHITIDPEKCANAKLYYSIHAGM